MNWISMNFKLIGRQPLIIASSHNLITIYSKSKTLIVIILTSPNAWTTNFPKTLLSYLPFRFLIEFVRIMWPKNPNLYSNYIIYSDNSKDLTFFPFSETIVYKPNITQIFSILSADFLEPIKKPTLAPSK